MAHRRRPARPLTFAVLSLLALATVVTGCQRSLFSGEDDRTQFESYNRVRQRYVPLEEQDVFGQPQPALRARLTQTR